MSTTHTQPPTPTRHHTQENKQRLAEAGVVGRVAALVPVGDEALQVAVLRLLHNLSFDAALRRDMVDAGLVPRVRACADCGE